MTSSPPSAHASGGKSKATPTPPATEASASPGGAQPITLATSPLEQTDAASVQESPPTLNSFPTSQPTGPQLPQDDLVFAVEDLPNHLDLDNIGEPDLVTPLPNFEQPGQSSWLSDFFPAGGLQQQGSGKSDTFSFSALLEGDGEDVEEIMRQSEPGMEQWISQNSGHGLFPQGLDSMVSLSRGPDFGFGSQEMLVLRFDRLTCGILSVKDGMHENPWRTLIWPLAKDSPALYHAIFSLAAFHSCKENPEMRVHGVDHMRQSITFMVQEIQNMRTDAALATSLALAFADTWDQHTRTCIEHLRGAKALVSQVLRAGMQNGFRGIELERVRFLYNTWLYMDVIARLTSRDECGDQEVEFSIFHLPKDAVHEIDPLMGCAATLFPLINQVARLIQRVRKSETNSISLISQAIELKRLVEQWEPPSLFEPPEDPTSEVQHSIQTAHAYQWATLLYLHQAVPEMPSEPASELAKRVLILLATVPASSRTTIIQMFPLLAAGCEAEEEEDRTWILNRWMVIQSRLMLGGIDRCLEVVREVWARRDAFHAEKKRRQTPAPGRAASYVVMDNTSMAAPSQNGPRQRNTSTAALNQRRNSTVSPLGNIEFEKTVRGKLHWVNIMEEWGWEGTNKQSLFNLLT